MRILSMVIALLLVSATASAQDSTQDSTQASVETDATSDPSSEETSSDEGEGAIRFTGVRIGVSLGGGFFVGSVSGGMGGMGAGIGAQFGPLGVLYKFHMFSGYYASGGISENFYAAWNTLLFDYKFLEFFEIGLGPSVDFVWNCRAVACQDSGPFFGFEARFAIRIPFMKIGIGIHPTFFPGGALGTAFLYFGI